MFLAEAAAPVTHVWHYWLGAVLALTAVMLVLSIGALYFRMVVRTRYVRKDS